MKRTYAALAGSLLLLIAAVSLKGALLEPPAPRWAAGAGFDTDRAVERLRRVLGPERPHPADSAEADAVRERILVEMRAVGLRPHVTDDFACNHIRRFPLASCARVRNIVATIGPPQGRHVLAVAHYDSSAAGPGAADDGLGVAVLLETAAQLSRRPLARPVTFLINEGEEAGLIGARAFLERHPLAGRVDSLVNIEARGVEGPAVMFETSRPNAPAIAHFARAADRPVTNSMMTDFYRMMPNSTDVAVFNERPWTILNLAIIGNETRYHSAGDDLEALDRSSVGHMGRQALATIADLAAGPRSEAAGERHYFDIAGRQLIVLPALMSFILLGLLLAFFGWTAWKRRSGLGLAAAAVVAALVDAAILAWIGKFLVGLARSGEWWRGYPAATSLAILLSALLACASAMILARGTPVGRLRAAFWLVFLLLALVFTLIAPGAAILFVFPPLVAAAGIGTRFERHAAIAAALLLFLVFAPFLHLLETLLGHGIGWAFAPLASAILWPWLIELKPLFATARLRFVLAGVGAATLAGWGAAAALPAYSEDRQQRFGIEYGWDSDARRGVWAVANDGAPLPGGFPGSWRRSEVAWSNGRRWVADAPPLPVPPPALELLGERQTPAGRAIRFRLTTGGAQAVTIRAPFEARLRSAGAAGFVRPVTAGTDGAPSIIRCTGRSCDGAVFEALLEGREAAEWSIAAHHAGLPPAAGPLVAARPRNARPHYSPDETVVHRRSRL